MKKNPPQETDKSAFFGLLTRAAHPLAPKDQKKAAVPISDGCNGSKIHSRSSEDASLKRDEKSR